jgi:membrane protein YqaA with SNARE-associated domain
VPRPALTLITLVSKVSASPVWAWIHDLGVPGLVLLGILDNAPFLSTPAGGVDAIVILLSWHNRHWWAYYALLATAGEVIGGYLTYRFAEKGGEKTLEQKFGKARTAQVYKWFQKRGTGLVVMVGAVLPPPFPFTPVLTAAGVGHYPKKKFLAALVAGRSVRFLAIAYLGQRFGEAVIDFFERYYRLAFYALVLLAILGGIAALVYFKWYKPRTQHEARGQS